LFVTGTRSFSLPCHRLLPNGSQTSPTSRLSKPEGEVQAGLERDVAQRCQSDGEFARPLLLLSTREVALLTIPRYGCYLVWLESVLERSSSRGSSSSRFVSSRSSSLLSFPQPTQSFPSSYTNTLTPPFPSSLPIVPRRPQSLPLSSHPPQTNAPKRRRSLLAPTPCDRWTMRSLHARSEGCSEEEVGG